MEVISWNMTSPLPVTGAGKLFTLQSGYGMEQG